MSEQIIVLGTIHGSAGAMPELEAMALEHVARSRTEPGCLAHSVQRSLEDPSLLVFVERWADRAALDQHFAVPASSTIIEAAVRLSVEPPTLDIYEVTSQAGPDLG